MLHGGQFGKVASGPLAQTAALMWSERHRPMGWSKVPGDAAIVGGLPDDPHPQASEYPITSVVLQHPSGKWMENTGRSFNDDHLSENEREHLFYNLPDSSTEFYNYQDPHMKTRFWSTQDRAMRAAQIHQRQRHRDVV